MLACTLIPAATAGTSAPSTYNASTDIISRKKPATPSLGAAGSILTDPTFGTRILRVTDANSLSNAVGAPFKTADPASLNSWNATSTLFVVRGNGVTIPFRFDPATMTVSRVPSATDPSGGLTLPFSGSFSFVRANVLYGAVGQALIEYDFDSGTSTTLADGAVVVPGSTGNALAPTASDDDTKLCLAFGAAQAPMPYVLVWDRASGGTHVLNLLQSTIDGLPAGSGLGSGATNAALDRSGRYVIVRTSGAQTVVWDVQAGTVSAVTVQAAGSDAAGFAVWTNQSGYTDVFTDPLDWSIRNLDAASLLNPSYLIGPTTLPFPHQSIYDGRLSWNNAQPGTMVPAVASIARDNRQTGKPWRAWDDEIVGVATDGSGTVWRFAHHRSLWDTNADDLPRATVSQDGRWCLFTSNWDRTLGSSSGVYRQDVFVAELNRTTMSTQVAITAPAANATVSGTVTVQATASDPIGIAGVQFQLDGANLGAEAGFAPYTVSWDTTNAQPGAHTLTAVARDNGGNLTTSAAVMVSVPVPDTMAPTVAITSPAAGATVSGTVTITASASDDVKVAWVQFYLDGAALGANVTTAPYTASWNTQGAKAGNHTLGAVARDTSGNQKTSAAVIVSVSAGDTTAPTVAITSPATGASVTGTVTIAASASDDVKVASVQFYLDGAALGGSLTAAPYSVSWNTQGAACGAHTVTAVARDTSGNQKTSAAVTLNVADLTAPTVAITSPATGASVTGTVTIAASASDDVKVASVQFYLDGATLGGSLTAAPYSISWNTQGAAFGAHTVTAVARDTSGNQKTSAAVTLNVADLTAPTVAVSAPLNGASVSGAVTLTAAATDNVKVAGVQFLVNGAPLGSEVLAAPFAAAWNTSATANGAYAVTARARDNSGNSATSAPVTVTVNNVVVVPAPAAPVLAAPANGATGQANSLTLSWNASTGATGYVVYLGTTAPPPQVGTTTGTTYTPGALFQGTTYYWNVAAQNATGSTSSATQSFATAAAAPRSGATGSSMLSYTSPYCGPSGGSTSWACGAWPAKNPPKLGAAGTTTSDPDTHNRVLRVTQSGSFGEAAGTAFKGFDAGWKQVWNANSTRFLVSSWNGGRVVNTLNWVEFNPASMSLTGAKGAVPYQFSDAQWDQYDPDLIVGLANGSAKTYNIKTGAWATLFDPSSVNWGATPWLSSWGGSSVCIAEGPQDTGYRAACRDNQAGVAQAINLRKQTINGSSFKVYLRGAPVTLPSGLTIHTITLAPDGRWLAIDTHGNSMCTLPTLSNYASTSLFIDLKTNTGYEWNAACGGTHWAYGFNSAMMQSTSPKWTAANGPNGPCNSDSRGIIRRNTDSTTDSSIAVTAPCSFFNPYTFNINVHLSWTNNLNDANVNKYPVLLATTNEGVADSFLWSDMAAMETGAAAYKGKLWRFAQTWNDETCNQCSYMLYSSPAISRDGRWAVFPSDWRGQTGSNGPCANGKRTDLFLFELK